MDILDKSTWPEDWGGPGGESREDAEAKMEPLPRPRHNALPGDNVMDERRRFMLSFPPVGCFLYIGRSLNLQCSEYEHEGVHHIITYGCLLYCLMWTERLQSRIPPSTFLS